MPGSSKNTRLQWVGDLHIHLASSNEVKFSAGNRTASVQPSGLALLEIFQKPTTIVEAAEALNRRAAGRWAWIDATNAIMTLRRAGLLIDADRGGAKVRDRPGGYDGTRIHIAMLNDRQRTTSFLAAIRQVVRPGDVVVDIGTGTGVLAIAAAQAGAARVYAVEATGIGKLAEANFRANGFEDRITLVTGWSMNVELPERADVLVSEIIGSHPFGERVIEVTADARRRLLKPDARMIPRHVKVFALPVAVPDRMIRRHLFTQERLETWRSWYGMDFGVLARSTPSSFSFSVNPWKLRGRALADPVLVAAADLQTEKSSVITADCNFTATASGRLNGVMIYFDLDLAPGVRLSAHPDRVNQTFHWKHRVWVLPEPLMLEPGDHYRLTHRYGVVDQPDSVRVVPAVPGAPAFSEHPGTAAEPADDLERTAAAPRLNSAG